MSKLKSKIVYIVEVLCHYSFEKKVTNIYRFGASYMPLCKK